MKKLLLVSIVALCACGPAAVDIKDTAPAGKINGVTWTYAKAAVFASGDDLDITLYSDSTVADCDKFASSLNTVFWTQPKKEGTTHLKLAFDGTGQTVTAYDGDTNYILTDGVIEISALSATSVTIGINASSEKTDVNGTVTAAICP